MGDSKPFDVFVGVGGGGSFASECLERKDREAVGVRLHAGPCRAAATPAGVLLVCIWRCRESLFRVYSQDSKPLGRCAGGEADLFGRFGADNVSTGNSLRSLAAHLVSF